MEIIITAVLVYVAIGAACFAHPASPALPDDFHWRNQIGVFRATLSEVLAKKEPGPGSSINKMLWSEYHRRFGEIAMEVLGMDATVMPDGSGDGSSEPNRWQQVFMSSRSETIWGGTAQVQRNIVGERVLGLPKEPAKELPKEPAKS